MELSHRTHSDPQPEQYQQPFAGAGVADGVAIPVRPDSGFGSATDASNDASATPPSSVGRSGNQTSWNYFVVRPVKLAARSAELIIWILLLVFVIFVLLRHRRPPTQAQPWNRWVPARSRAEKFDDETRARRNALGLEPPADSEVVFGPSSNRKHHPPSAGRRSSSDLYEDLGWHGDRDFLDQHDESATSPSGHAGEVDVEHSMPEWKRKSLAGRDANGYNDGAPPPPDGQDGNERWKTSNDESDEYNIRIRRSTADGRSAALDDRDARRYNDDYEYNGGDGAARVDGLSDDDQYPYSSWETPSPPRTRPPLSVADIKRQIRRLEMNEEFSLVKLRLKELEELKKQRQRILDEYDFGDEQDAFREKERDWQRIKWNEMEKKFQRWVDRARREYRQGRDPSSLQWPQQQQQQPDVDGAMRRASPAAGEFGDDACPDLEPAHAFVPYGQQLQSSIPDTSNAYVTYVSSAEFVPAAATLMFSIAASGSQYARAICITEDISTRDRDTLSMLGQLIVIDKIPSPRYIDNPRYRETFTKLRIWQLAMFRRVLYIDTDVVVTRNMDDLFDIAEWAVPMDAEQNRYSTGMMVCEPSLRTFDIMEKELQTTTTSMELPDLLFLKAYFDNPAHNRKINIIPRWYQVYQEEFGSQYSTYLTNRKQKLTIFDSRIHGIHYPGAGKPWGGYATKLAKYRPHFCHWRSAEVFQYEPQFLWYVQHEMMLRALARTKPSSLFDYEHGGSVIVLRKWVEDKRHEEEEAEKNRNRWNTDYYGGRSPQRAATSPRGNDHGAQSVNDFEWRYEGGKWIKVFADSRKPNGDVPSKPTVPVPAADPLRVFQPASGSCRFLVTVDLPRSLLPASAAVPSLSAPGRSIALNEVEVAHDSQTSDPRRERQSRAAESTLSTDDDVGAAEESSRSSKKRVSGPSQEKPSAAAEGDAKLSGRQLYRAADHGEQDDGKAEDADASDASYGDDDSSPEDEFQELEYNDDNGIAFDNDQQGNDAGDALEGDDSSRDEGEMRDEKIFDARGQRHGGVPDADEEIDEEQLLDIENRLRKSDRQSDYEAYQDAYDRHENPYRHSAQRRLSAILADSSMATEHVSRSAARSGNRHRTTRGEGRESSTGSGDVPAASLRGAAGSSEKRKSFFGQGGESKRPGTAEPTLGSQALTPKRDTQSDVMHDTDVGGKPVDTLGLLTNSPTAVQGRRTRDDQQDIPGATTTASPPKKAASANNEEGDEEFLSRLDKLVQGLNNSQKGPSAERRSPVSPKALVTSTVQQRQTTEVVPGAAIDFSLVPPLVVSLPQVWADTDLETYEWVISWCSKTKIRSSRSSPCGKPAHVSQYSLGLCRSNFDESFEVLPLYHRRYHHQQKAEQPLESFVEAFPLPFQLRRNVTGVAGVVFRSKVTVDSPTRAKWFEVLVRCDSTMPPHTAALDSGTEDLAFPKLVVVNTSHPPHDRRYQIHLRSRCACLGGCDSLLTSPTTVKAAAATAAALQAAVGKTSFAAGPTEAENAAPRPTKDAATIDEHWAKARYVARLFEAWKQRVVGPGRVSLTEKCSRRVEKGLCEGNLAVQQVPGAPQPLPCVWSATSKQCVVNTMHRWLLVHFAEARQFCNCTHVGGDAERRRPATLESCAAEALAAGANVINYVGDETQLRDPTSPESSSPATTVASPQTPSPFVRRSYERNAQARTTVGGPATAAPQPPTPVRRTPLACFYKKCSLGSLYTGAIPTATYRPGSPSDTFTGFDVYFLNPLYRENATVAPTESAISDATTADTPTRKSAETTATPLSETRGGAGTRRLSMFP